MHNSAHHQRCLFVLRNLEDLRTSPDRGTTLPVLITPLQGVTFVEVLRCGPVHPARRAAWLSVGLPKNEGVMETMLDDYFFEVTPHTFFVWPKNHVVVWPKNHVVVWPKNHVVV
jgi:hypothetical protein